MGTKLDSQCLQNCADDEPIFVLCARDPIAPEIIDRWAEIACMFGHRTDKAMEAHRQAEEMREWRLANPDRCKKPS